MTIKRAIAALSALAMLTSPWAGAAERMPLPRAQPFIDPGVQVAYLVDLDSGAEFVSRNADRRFVPASITKAMTLLVAFDLIAARKLHPDQSFAISDGAFAAWHRKGSTMYIVAGDTVRVDDLLMGIANISANDASVVLAEGAVGSVDAWVARMNRTAREIGMRDTRFGGPNGWPDEATTFTTARDLALLARALTTRHKALYARYVGKPGFAFNGIAQANHDPVTGKVAGADGIKTGFTRQAGHGFLGSAMRDGRRLAVVVAVSDTQEVRNALAGDLLEWGFAQPRTRQLFRAGETVGTAMVQGGDRLSVPLVTGALPVGASVQSAGAPDMQLIVRYAGPLQAPIAPGARVAELEIAGPGLPSSRVPLYAGAPVGPAGPFDRLINGLAGMFRW